MNDDFLLDQDDAVIALFDTSEFAVSTTEEVLPADEY